MSVPTLFSVLLVAAVAASGAAYGVMRLVDPAQPAPENTSRAALGQSFPTAFGEVSTVHIERTPGLAPEALSGVTHGVQGLVPPGSEQLGVSLLLHNTTGHQTRWATKFFSLKSGADGNRTTTPVTVGDPGGYIPSGALVEALLTFVVLSDGNAQRLVYHDPANGKAVEISLGRAYRAGGSPADAHGH